jgi:sigma-B regulation protein RsbU (phosphoserine phosphatase)
MAGELTLPGNLDALEPIREYVTRASKTAGLEDSDVYQLCLAVDEIATNVVLHGYEEAGLSGSLTIKSSIENGRLVIQLADTGKPYDPAKHHVPDEDDLALPLEERQVGGLGIMLALQGVDDLQYESTARGNAHRFVKLLPQSASQAPLPTVDELSDERRKLGILLNISRSLGQEVQLDRLLTLIVAEVTSAMEAERSSLLLFDAARSELVSKVAEGMSTREIRVALGVGIAGATAQTRAIINIPDAYKDSRFNQSFDRASGFHTRSILSAPIINQNGRLVGVVQVLNKKNEQAFTNEDERFLEAICIHLGIAIERAEMVAAYLQSQLLKESLQLARDIQMGLVPQVFPAFPDIPAIDVYAAIDPALDVGGDLYDYFALDKDRICFIIGDVSDKGIPAALFMAMVRTAFHMGALASNESIDAIVRKLNQFLCTSNSMQMFVTVFAGILDLRTGLIEYADGGHELPFIVSAKGETSVVDKIGGLALGFMPDYVYRSGTIQLIPGDSLVIYTDGVTEAMNPAHELFGAERIHQTLGAAPPGASAKVLTELLLKDVTTFVNGAPQSDDITLVILRYIGN